MQPTASNDDLHPEDAKALSDEAANDLDRFEEQRQQKLLEMQERGKKLFENIPIPARGPGPAPKSASNRYSPLGTKQETRATLQADAEAAKIAHQEQMAAKGGGAVTTSC